LVALPAAAQETGEKPGRRFRIFGQTTSLLELNQAENEANPRDVDYTKFKQLASFNIEWSKFTIGAQAEYLHWSVPLEQRDPLDLDRLREGFELRKYFFDYQSKKFVGRLGTFFSSLGRGLTLYVQRNEALGFDEPIHGGIATATLKHLDISVLGGRVTVPGVDYRDEVFGGRILGRLPLGFYVGGSAVRANLEEFRVVEEVEVWSVEGGATELGGIVDVHAEWAEIEKVKDILIKEGHGRYFSASAYIGPVNILAEYKDYYNFAYRYNLPPNAGRVDESYNHNDVKGPRLLVSLDILSTNTLLHASYGTFNTHKTPTSPGGTEGDEQIEWYAGIEQWIGRVYFDGSYFDRNRTDLETKEEHTQADLHVTVGQAGEIIVGYDKRLEASSYFNLGTTRTYLAYSLSPWGSASLRYAWEDKSSLSTKESEDFWGVELQYLPKPTIIVTVFGGGDPGGLVCAGGQCRIEPRFKGVKANFTWRF
jgi:hypothetical protein